MLRWFLLLALFAGGAGCASDPALDSGRPDAADDRARDDSAVVFDTAWPADAGADIALLPPDGASDAAPMDATAHDATVTDVNASDVARRDVLLSDACPGANLLDDPHNCGACGVVCCGGWCFNGVCGTEGPPPVIACASHRTDCTGPVPVNPLSDPSNCGACGAVCPTGCPCVSGMCGCACPMGLARCGSLCVDLAADARNCGACGSTCGADQICVGRMCVAVTPRDR